MTPADRALWEAVRKRVAVMSPDMVDAYLQTYRNLVAGWTEVQMAEALANPEMAAEALVTEESFLRATQGLRAEVVKQVRGAAMFYGPRIGAPGASGTTLAVFDVLNPNVLEAVRTLQSRVMTGLQAEVRETVRAVTAASVEQGLPFATTGRRIREVVGLAPNQLEAVENFRRALEQGSEVVDGGTGFTRALNRKLRDKRFDRTLRRLRKSKGSLTPAQIDKMTERYATRFKAWNANVHARTATTDSQRLGKHLAMQQAIDMGYVNAALVWSRWVDSGDNRVRELHVAANGEEVRFGDPFPTTGEVIPGESTYNCRCIKVDYIRDPSAIPPVQPPPDAMAGWFAGGQADWAFQRHDKTPGKGFTPGLEQQKIALRSYQNGGYRGINKYLRDGPNPNDVFIVQERHRKRIAAIDEIFDRNGLTTEDAIVWRGGGGWGDLLNPGDMVEDLGFTSTSWNPVHAADFERDAYFKNLDSPGEPDFVLFRVGVPSGSRAVRMESFIGDGSEGEILLDRGGKYLVTRNRTLTPDEFTAEFGGITVPSRVLPSSETGGKLRVIDIILQAGT